MPKVSLVELYWVLPWATVTPRVYSGCAPSWYGHQTCGLVIVRAGKLAGVNWTVWVVLAGTVAFWETVIGVPLAGGGMVAGTGGARGAEGCLVTAGLRVSGPVGRS